MRKRPFLLLACMFLAGVLSAETKAPVLGMPAFLLFLYAMPWKERGIRRVLFAAGLPLMFFLGMLRMSSETAFRGSYLPNLSDGQEVRLVGKIERIETKTYSFYYYLSDCAICLSGEKIPCNDVIAYVSADDYSIGQTLLIQGTISLFEEAANEGGFDAAHYYQSQKIDFAVFAGNIQCVNNKGSRYRQFLERVRKRLQEVLLTSANDDGVLAAMLLGEKSSLDGEIKSLYQQAGIAHILAISGLHVSLLGMGLYRLLRHRCHLGYLSASGATAFFMISYMLMSGNSVSTRRAVGMLFIYLLADVLGRGYDLLSALSLVVMVLLWENPFLTGYSGFLFSVAAVLGVGVGDSVLGEWKAFKNQRAGLWTSLIIQLFTLPLVAYNYYEIPVYAMVLNLFVLASVARLLELAVAGAVSGVFLPKMGKLLLVPCGWILKLYQWLCQCFVSLPGAQYMSGKPAVWKIAVYYLMLAGLLFLLWCRIRLRAAKQHGVEKCGELQEKRRGMWLEKLCLAAAVAVILFVLLFPARKEFEIDVLDVGQGDGIYLCTSDGVSLFIDGGSTDVKDVGKYRILPFLKAKEVKKISYWFVSHTDADHISGLEEVLASGYRIEHLVLAKAVSEEKKTVELVKLAKKAGTKVLYMKAGDVLCTQEARLQCLYPAADAGADDSNDLCLVLRFEDGGTAAMFAGDISTEVEETLVAQGLCAKVDLYKADHHGSNNSNSMTFLQALSPRLTVASAGEGNRYGHPGAEALQRICRNKSRFLCTIQYGQIRLKRRKGLLQVYTRFGP